MKIPVNSIYKFEIDGKPYQVLIRRVWWVPGKILPKIGYQVEIWTDQKKMKSKNITNWLTYFPKEKEIWYLTPKFILGIVQTSFKEVLKKLRRL